MADYDVIVIGAGHNGLTTSTLLQKNGLKVLDLEKNGYVGGLASNTSFFPGHINNTGAWIMAFANKTIWDLLEVKKYGFELIPFEVFYSTIISPNDPSFTMYLDHEQLINSIIKDFGKETAIGFGRFMKALQPFGIAMRQALMNPPTSVGKVLDSMPSVEGKDTLRKIFYGSYYDLLEEYLPGDRAEVIKAAMSASVGDGFWGGPMSPGSAWVAAVHLSQSEGTGAFMIKGGIGKYSETLAKVFQANGGEIRLNSAVKKVIVKNNKAVGVQLFDGQEISADLVVSNCNATYSMINLIGEENLPEQYTGMVKNIKYRSPCIQIYYRMSGLPEYEGRFAHINEGKKRNQVFIFPGVRGMEAGWDACKHGRIPDEQSITSIIMTMYDRSIAPEGEHCWVMFPYYFPMNAPRDQWSGIAEQMADKCLETYTRYASNIPNIVLDRKIMTAADYERIYNATNGDFVHGSMAIDQMLDMRPVPGWSNYSTPVDNFYLCGAANHPGMGVTSLPGYIAAKTILKNWSKTGSKKSVTSEGLN